MRRQPAELLSLLLLPLAWRGVGAVTVEGLKKHKHGDIDEDEFAWGKLNGRCCFLLKESCPFEGAPRDQCTKSSPSSCKECDVWSEPDNYCHLSKENCLSCGMLLYCPRPPPLLDGNKVCTAGSRVGQGCVDEQDTGLCAGKDFTDCEDACRANAACQLFVFYPEERKGSCVLCRDLFSFERTPDAATRAYAVTPAAPPPTPAASLARLYSIVLDAPPPPPPRLSPPPTPTLLGHHRVPGGREHTECTFDHGVEYTVDRDEGYAAATAPTKEECCALCSRTAGCTDFVFEGASGVSASAGTCVILPHVADEAEIEAYPNPSVVSGSIRISIAPTVIPSSACTFVESAGYALGALGVGRPVAGGSLEGKEDCCQSCGAVPACAKFSWQQESKTCMLHEAFAEVVRVQDQVAGTVQTKLSRGKGEPPLLAISPPSMPSFATLLASPPPPPPAKSDSDVTQVVLQRVSVGVVGVMALTLLLCVYLFFSPQILKAIYHLTAGRLGRLGPQHTRLPAVEPAADLADDAYPIARKREAAGLVKVSVDARQMTQSRQLDVRRCTSVSSLRSLIFREFSTQLKGVRPSESSLFCLAPVSDEGGGEQQLMWCLVTERSDGAKVLACPSFKVVAEMAEEELEAITVAFERQGSHHAAEHSRAAGEAGGERGRGLRAARGKGKRRLCHRAREGGEGARSHSPSDEDDEGTSCTSLTENGRGSAGLPHSSRALSAVISGWDEDDSSSKRLAPKLDDFL
ncbi:hypothetical protein AB1Y20_004449 [Prymnesium parvum]|uniref:Apple domain-containing protein n=1 Tax=Prymnesium parvum TaxID=97485 RepID=A0AB34IZA7_PRYPA